MSAGGGGTSYERWTIMIDSGQTQHLNMVRTNGWRVRGQIRGLDQIDVRRAVLYVRSGAAAGDSRNFMEHLLPCYDALAYPGNFGKGGDFRPPCLSRATTRSSWRFTSRTGIHRDDRRTPGKGRADGNPRAIIRRHRQSNCHGRQRTAAGGYRTA